MMLVFGQTVERNLISIFSITCAGQDFTIPALSITYLDIGLEHLLNFSYHGPHLVFKGPRLPRQDKYKLICYRQRRRYQKTNGNWDSD